jgi:hypothetical protein
MALGLLVFGLWLLPSSALAQTLTIDLAVPEHDHGPSA